MLNEQLNETHLAPVAVETAPATVAALSANDLRAIAELLDAATHAYVNGDRLITVAQLAAVALILHRECVDFCAHGERAWQCHACLLNVAAGEVLAEA